MKKSRASKPKDWKSQHAHLFKKNARDYRIGRDVLPKKRDLSRFVKWPRYVRLQRQRAILKKRLKVPPAINHFAKAIDKNQASTLFRLMSHYRPESPEEKKNRLKAAAEAQAAGEEPAERKKPMNVKYGIKHVTQLVEQKKAKLVVIAHDVDPIELVVWLPALCRKMDVPYCIVKGKARLGHLVYKKTATCVAVTDLRKEDKHKLDQLVSNLRIQFNEASDIRKWGQGELGVKTIARMKKVEKAAKKSRTV